MKNPKSPDDATLTYACLALVVRLISAQSQVFNIWYQRRSYERSRGEMITMLYEKTLNRKILGAKQDAPEEEADDNTNGHANGHGNGESDRLINGHGNGSSPKDKTWSSRAQHVLHGMMAPFRALWGKKQGKTEKKEDAAASMGKILNLMR